MEGLITENLIIGVVLMLVGMGLLSWCQKMERKDFKIRNDPREKWAYIDGAKADVERKSSIRGTLMALVGGGLALWGFVMLVIHFSSWNK